MYINATMYCIAKQRMYSICTSTYVCNYKCSVISLSWICIFFHVRVSNITILIWSKRTYVCMYICMMVWMQLYLSQSTMYFIAEICIIRISMYISTRDNSYSNSEKTLDKKWIHHQCSCSTLKVSDGKMMCIHVYVRMYVCMYVCICLVSKESMCILYMHIIYAYLLSPLSQASVRSSL